VTRRERNLRERIDFVTDERDTARAQVDRLRKRRQARGGRRYSRPACVYCGSFVRSTRLPGGAVACGSHRDLLAIDPFYADPEELAA